MTDNRTTELLPCPICGRKATVSSWWSDAEECGIAGVGCSRESYVNGYECARIIVMRIDEKTALEDAVRIWNTRAAHGTLTAEQVREAIERNFGKVAVIDDGNERVEWREGWVVNVGINYKAIADELNAKLGSGTCENADKYPSFRFTCSECGCRIRYEDHDGEPYMFVDECAEVPRFCPNCGARIRKAVTR